MLNKKNLCCTLMLIVLGIYAETIHFPLTKDLSSNQGKGQILTPENQVQFQNDALVLSGKNNELVITMPDFKGESGTVIYDFSPLNWSEENLKESMVFLQAIDGQDGNFSLYKYAETPGIWLLTQAKMPDGKYKNQFPIMDRKALVKTQNNQWEQLAFVWSSGNFAKVYLNGELVGSTTGSAFFPAGFSKMSIGRNSGVAAKKQTAIKNLIFDSRPFSEQEIKLHYMQSRSQASPSTQTILPISAMSAPQLDGVIGEMEYPVRIPGLLDSSKNFECDPAAAFTVLGENNDFFYLGAEIILPVGITPQSAAVRHDDPAQISKGDLFVLCIASPTGKEKTFSGLYLTLTSQNTVYDAETTVDWGKGSCERDAGKNFDIQSASKVANGKWTVELAIPKKNLTTPESLELTTGFFINGVRYTLTPQPIWFDHHQGFAHLRKITDSKFSIAYNDFNQGVFQQTCDIQPSINGSGKLNFELSSPDYRHSSEGMVVDQLIGEKIEILSGRNYDRQQLKFELSAGKEIVEKISAKLPTPDIYLASGNMSWDGQIIFQRQMLFRYSQPLDLTLSPVPSQKKLNIRPLLYGDAKDKILNGKLQITFQKEGQKVLQQFIAPETSTAIALDRLTPGTYEIELALLDQSGKQTAKIVKNWVSPQMEFWRERQSGIEALSPDWCPEPWSPIQEKNNLYSVWGRTYDFSGDSFLSQITSQNIPLLQKPATVGFSNGSKNIVAQWDDLQIKSRHNGRAEMTKSARMGDFKIIAATRLEFDGLLIVNMQIIPEKKTQVDSLYLEFDLQDLPLMAIQSRRWWQIGATQSEAWNSFPSIWLGNDHAGLNFSAENSKGWWINSALPRVQLAAQPNGNSSLKLLIVNQPGLVEKSLDFTFMIQAGPVKPNFTNHLDFRMAGGKNPTQGASNAFYADPRFWSSSYSRPKPLNQERFDDMIATMHQADNRVYCYLTPFSISTYEIIPSDTPVKKWSESLDAYNKLKKKDTNPVEEYFFNAVDWNLKPVQFTGDGVAGRETSELAYVSPDSSWADYFAGMVEDILKNSQMDGFYFDLPLPQENFDENKNLTSTTRDGLTEGSVQLLAARNLYKRLYYLFGQYRAGRHPWMITHHIRELYPINAFSDLELHGEGVKPKKRFEYTDTYLQKNVKGTPVAQVSDPQLNFSAAAFRAAHGGTHSIPSIILPQYGYSAELGRDGKLSREHLGWALSHGALLWPVYINSGTVFAFWQKLEQEWNGFKDCNFVSGKESGIKVTPAMIQFGLYRKFKSGEALLVLFNPDKITQNVTIENIPAEFKSAANLENGQPVELKTPIQLSIPPIDFIAISFRP